MLTYTLTDQSVTVLGDDFVPKTMPASHPAFERVVTALKAGNDNDVKTLMDLPNAIASFMQGKIQVTERQLFYDGKPVTNSLASKILQFMGANQPELAEPLINFLEKVKQNPSRRAAEGLYDWSVRSGLPITPDGDIIAYKIVRSDYLDYHSQSFDNSVGKVVSVQRNEVDEDPDQTCSHGLHFCSINYLPHYYQGDSGRHIMVVKINPADVVAFPRDYNVSKGRACRYEVVGEVPEEKAAEFFPAPVTHYEYDDFDRVGRLNGELDLDCYYRTRDGRIVQVVDYQEDQPYPYSAVLLPGRLETHVYTEYGSWTGHSEEHPLDLVEDLGYELDEEPIEEPVVEQPKSLFDSLFDAIFGPK